MLLAAVAAVAAVRISWEGTLYWYLVRKVDDCFFSYTVVTILLTPKNMRIFLSSSSSAFLLFLLLRLLLVSGAARGGLPCKEKPLLYY